MKIRTIAIRATIVSLVWSELIFGAVKVYDVRDYGAKSDGKTLCTRSIQRAIDECSRAGGGTVYFPGRHLPLRHNLYEK